MRLATWNVNSVRQRVPRLLPWLDERRPDVIRLPGRTLEITGGPFQANADGEVSEPLRRRVWTMQPAAWRCILPPP